MKKNILTYIGAAVIGASVLLPSHGCGGKNDVNKKTSSPASVVGLSNVRDCIDDLINAGEVIEIVVSQNFTPEERNAAVDVGTRLDNEMRTKYGLAAHMVAGKYDKDVSDVYGKTRIFVGKETSNLWVDFFRSTLTVPQDKILPVDTGVIQCYKFSNGKKAIVVTGLNDFDVEKAGRGFAEYDNLVNFNPIDLDGQIIYIIGPDLWDIQSVVFKK